MVLTSLALPLSLETLHGIVKKNDHYIALHGTDGLPDQLWKDCVKAGARKVRSFALLVPPSRLTDPRSPFHALQFNINSWARDPTMKHIETSLVNGVPLPQIYDEASDVFSGVCERFFTLLGSAGKA